MSFTPWALCKCCQSCPASTYGPGCFHDLLLCSRCWLKLKSVLVALSQPQKTFDEVKAEKRAEAIKDVELQVLETMWKLDGSWIKEGAVWR